MTWRDKFRPRVAAILEANLGATRLELRTILREAWTETRRGWEYSVWRQEINRQLRAKGIEGVTNSTSRVRRSRPKPPKRGPWISRSAQAIEADRRLADFRSRQRSFPYAQDKDH